MGESTKGEERSGRVRTDSKAEKGPNFTGSTKEFVEDAVEHGHGERKDKDGDQKPRRDRAKPDAEDSFDAEKFNDVA